MGSRDIEVVQAFRPAGSDVRLSIGLALIFLGLAVPAASGAQTESPRPIYAPILRTQRVGAGVIRIVYDLNGAPSTLVTVSLEASNDGGQTFAVRPRATKGDVGPNVTPGAGKVIEWDSTKDIDDLQLDRYVFRVVVSPTAAPNATALKIVILEGEGAVNNVRQKAAVAPVVEVRDRNDLPVFGATVTFTIAVPNATFANGASTMTVTTNATGRAVAAGINPLKSGAVEIAVQAAFQGQVAAATIQQTNTAQSAATSSGGNATVGKPGGGLSRGAIAGLVGGAGAAAAAIVATKKNSSTPSGPRRAVLTIVSSPNPVPFRDGSGTPCNGTAGIWEFGESVTETGGVGVTITQIWLRFLGINPFPTTPGAARDSIVANGSTSYFWRWCFTPAVTRMVQSTYSGTDANGNAFSFDGPVVVLSPQPGFP